jgi:hypothetical protein
LQGLQNPSVNRAGEWKYALVPVDEATAATAATGLTIDEILALPATQLLERVFADGRRELALRMPVELAGASASARPVPAPAVSRVTTTAEAPTSEQVRNRQSKGQSRH